MSKGSAWALAMCGCVVVEASLAICSVGLLLVVPLYRLGFPGMSPMFVGCLIPAMGCGFVFSRWLCRRPTLNGLFAGFAGYVIYFILAGGRVMNLPGSPTPYPPLSSDVVMVYLRFMIPEMAGMIAGTVLGIWAGRLIWVRLSARQRARPQSST